MTRNEADERRHTSDVAAGKAPADLVLRGGLMLNVHTGRIAPGDLAIAGPRIAAVGDVTQCVGDSTKVVDCSGMTLLPGFIDTHIHVGGSQVTIQRLAEAMVPHGTAAVCTDFYEIATLAGLPAVLHELDAAGGTGLDILLSPFFAGVLGLGPFGDLGRFSYDDLERLLEHEACVELREWNCWASWLPLEGQARTYETALRLGRTIGGHLEGLSGPNLQASVSLGVMSEHEAVTTQEALERVDLGLVVQIREGSGAADFDDLLPAILEHGADPSRFAFCTDEQELWSIDRDGHIDRLVRLAVANGVAPVDAVKMATLNAAESMGIAKDFGSLLPGRIATVVAVEDLSTFPIRMVVSRGEVAARDGEYLLTPPAAEYPDAARRTVHVERPLAAADFRFDLPDGTTRMRVMGVDPGKLLTHELIEDVELRDGSPVASDLARIAVIDRHEGGDRRALGLVRGYDLRQGALAATVNPGVMNLMVLGVDEEDMIAAAQRVIEMQGGIAVAVGGSVRADVALPIYGILSDEPATHVAAACRAVTDVVRDEMGSPIEGLLTSAGFLCLTVSIPSLKICDQGLVRVARDGGEAVELVVTDA